MTILARGCSPRARARRTVGAADLGLETFFVAFVDRSLALIEMKQRARLAPVRVVGQQSLAAFIAPVQLGRLLAEPRREEDGPADQSDVGER